MLPKRIREMQRENERDLLNHLRREIAEGNYVSSTALFSNAWRSALERLEAAGKIVYYKPRKWRGLGYYKPVRYARPVTNAN